MSQVDTNNTRSEEYRETLMQIAETGECPAPFCKQKADYHQHGYVLEGRFWRVTRNTFNYQGAEHAFLIVHKEHIESIDQMIKPEADAELMRIVRSLVTEYNIPGATLMMRFGKTSRTGASITHLHAHLIAGHERQDGSNPIMAVVGFEAPG